MNGDHPPHSEKGGKCALRKHTLLGLRRQVWCVCHPSVCSSLVVHHALPDVFASEWTKRELRVRDTRNNRKKLLFIKNHQIQIWQSLFAIGYQRSVNVQGFPRWRRASSHRHAHTRLYPFTPPLDYCNLFTGVIEEGKCNNRGSTGRAVACMNIFAASLFVHPKDKKDIKNTRMLWCVDHSSTAATLNVFLPEKRCVRSCHFVLGPICREWRRAE